MAKLVTFIEKAAKFVARYVAMMLGTLLLGFLVWGICKFFSTFSDDICVALESAGSLMKENPLIVCLSFLLITVVVIMIDKVISVIKKTKNPNKKTA